MKIFGITGWKNSGKTTLTEKLVTELTRRGLSVSTLKRAHCQAETDKPGTDSYRHRQAGARQVVLATPDRWALMTELRGAPEPELRDLVARLDPVDIVLVEGWKADPLPKIECRRIDTATRPPMGQDSDWVRAYATDHPMPQDLASDRPVFAIDDIPAIADFVLREATDAV